MSVTLTKHLSTTEARTIGANFARCEGDGGKRANPELDALANLQKQGRGRRTMSAQKQKVRDKFRFSRIRMQNSIHHRHSNRDGALKATSSSLGKS
jgi:hypothetical protein